MLVCGKAVNRMKEGRQEEAADLWSWPPCQFIFLSFIGGHVFLPLHHEASCDINLKKKKKKIMTSLQFHQSIIVFL